MVEARSLWSDSSRGAGLDQRRAGTVENQPAVSGSATGRTEAKACPKLPQPQTERLRRFKSEPTGSGDFRLRALQQPTAGGLLWWTVSHGAFQWRSRGSATGVNHQGGFGADPLDPRGDGLAPSEVPTRLPTDRQMACPADRD